MSVIQTSTLHRSRDLVQPSLRAAVDSLDPASRTAASYHFGWLSADGVTAAAGDGGKAVRPALALLSAELAGADAEVAVPAAVAVELVHNFSLLHDDVMDRDVTRRHRRTVWSLWGDSCAILTGDALLTLAHRVLLGSGSLQAAAATTLLLDATHELIRGQVQDVAFEQRDTVGVEECLRMAAGKTGALLSVSATIGAVLAGAPPEVCAVLAGYGAGLGAAFQLVDDLLGIWGDPQVTGKPVLSDLRARKKSLPVAYALSRGGTAARELADWYQSPGDPTEEELVHAAALVDRNGGRQWAASEAARQIRFAEAGLDRVYLPAGPRDELIALGRYVTTRER